MCMTEGGIVLCIIRYRGIDNSAGRVNGVYDRGRVVLCTIRYMGIDYITVRVNGVYVTEGEGSIVYNQV